MTKDGCQKRDWSDQEKAVGVQMRAGKKEDGSEIMPFFLDGECNPIMLINVTDQGWSEKPELQIQSYGSFMMWDICDEQAGCNLK